MYPRECPGQIVNTSISGKHLARYLDELAAETKTQATDIFATEYEIVVSEIYPEIKRRFLLGDVF